MSVANVRTSRNGRLDGVAVSAVNQIRGRQSGLTIGIVNYAWSLRGVQIGVLNIVKNGPGGGRVWRPIANWNFQ